MYDLDGQGAQTNKSRCRAWHRAGVLRLCFRLRPISRHQSVRALRGRFAKASAKALFTQLPRRLAASSGWVRNSACFVSTVSGTSRGSRHRISISLQARSDVYSSRATGHCGSAPTKVLQVGRAASLLTIRGLPVSLFLRCLRIVKALYGSAGRGFLTENCAQYITAVSIATEMMAVLAAQCSRCMKTAKAISGRE